MRLRKTKEEVLSEIYSRVSGSVSGQLYNLNLNNGSNGMQYVIQQAIATGVADAFRCLLDNQYTDDDFEKDMQLK
jgi:hypothetical protein